MTESSNANTNSNAVTERFSAEPLKCANMLTGIIAKYILKSQYYPKLPWVKSAWASAGFPVELLWAYNIFVLHPENAACVAGTRKFSLGFIERAEQMGFSRDLCSYMKTNIGAVNKKVGAPIGGIVKPSFTVSTNTICDTHVKWFQIQARHFGVPYFGFDVPSVVAGTDEGKIEDYTDYLLDQFFDFKDFVKKTTGREFNQEKFLTILKKSDRLAELWQQCYEYRKYAPSPFVFQDTLRSIFPMVVMPGLDPGIKYFEAILAELKERAAAKKGAVPAEKEKYRLCWEGIPLWYRVKLLHQMTAMGGMVVYEPYTYSFGPRKRTDLPFDKLIRETCKLMLHFPYNYNLDARIKYFEQIIDDYKLDGVILHANMSCRPSCAGMIDLKNAIQKDKGVPVLILDCDQNDPRAFSEGPIMSRLEGFFEMMANNKKK